MRHTRLWGLASLLIVVAVTVAYAQTTETLPPTLGDDALAPATPPQIDLLNTTWGNPKAGEEKAIVCAACHGVDGNSPIPLYPNIAGQSERYIAHQLALIASSQRTAGAVVAMVPFVQELSAQDMRDIGAYYANQKSTTGTADGSAFADVTQEGMASSNIGESLYRGGDPARGIPACLACHGPDGSGNPGPAYPRVGGQHAEYTARRLSEYQAGVTSEADPRLFNMMAGVAKPLTEQEIHHLATYLQGLSEGGKHEAATTSPAPTTDKPEAPTTAAQSS